MRVSISWLRELVDFEVSVEELAELLSMSGFEVESIENLGENSKGVLIGRVEKVVTHPNADKLSVCEVNIGKNQNLQIVCGAKNVRQGIHVPVAPVGTNLKAKGLLIKQAEIRGVESSGMICSLEELGTEKKSSGIAILDEIVQDIPKLGTDIGEALNLNDQMLELAITANRPDGMSMFGIAREVSAITKNRLKQTDNSITTNDLNLKSFESSSKFKDCGIFSLTKLLNIRSQKPISKVIVNRLEKCGIKSINNVVDICNYVMLEMGQPFHCYDLDSLTKITKQEISSSSFEVRKGIKGEIIKGLDGENYKIDENCTVITCNQIPISLAGLMGGFETSVTPETTNILLEAATFKPINIRQNSRSAGLRTDSSSRYEKGVSPELTLECLKRVVCLLTDINKLDVEETWIYQPKEKKQFIKLSRDSIHKVLGPLNNITDLQKRSESVINTKKLSLTEKNLIEDNVIVNILENIGCSISDQEEGWNVSVHPSRENDLKREIDLIEEIARIIGYDNFDTNLPYPISPGGLDPRQKIENKLKHYFCANGFQEVVTFSLVGEDKNDKSQLRIENPFLEETSCMRTNLVNEHLKICRKNIQSSFKAVWIYEFGNIFKISDGQIKQLKILGGIISGEKRAEEWVKSGKVGQLNYYEGRGKLQSVLGCLKAEVTEKSLTNDPMYHPGRASNLIMEGKIIGKFGQIHPLISEQYEIPTYTYMFELSAEEIITAATRKQFLTPTFKMFKTVPAIERDISMLVNKQITSLEIKNYINKIGKSLLESVNLIDKFEGKNLKEDECSLTFRLKFRSEKTLKESDIEPLLNKIKEGIQSKFKVILRI